MQLICSLHCLKPPPGGGGAWSAATSYPSLSYAICKKTNSFSGARPLLALGAWAPSLKYKAGIVVGKL